MASSQLQKVLALYVASIHGRVAIREDSDSRNFTKGNSVSSILSQLSASNVDVGAAVNIRDDLDRFLDMQVPLKGEAGRLEWLASKRQGVAALQAVRSLIDAERDGGWKDDDGRLWANGRSNMWGDGFLTALSNVLSFSDHLTKMYVNAKKEVEHDKASRDCFVREVAWAFGSLAIGAFTFDSQDTLDKNTPLLEALRAEILDPDNNKGLVHHLLNERRGGSVQGGFQLLFVGASEINAVAHTLEGGILQFHEGYDLDVKDYFASITMRSNYDRNQMAVRVTRYDDALDPQEKPLEYTLLKFGNLCLRWAGAFARNAKEISDGFTPDLDAITKEERENPWAPNAVYGALWALHHAKVNQLSLTNV